MLLRPSLPLLAQARGSPLPTHVTLSTHPAPQASPGTAPAPMGHANMLSECQLASGGLEWRESHLSQVSTPDLPGIPPSLRYKPLCLVLFPPYLPSVLETTLPCSHEGSGGK